MPAKTAPKQRFTLPDGNTVTLGEEIGSGNQGIVHLVEEQPDVVAKIIYQPPPHLNLRLETLIRTREQIQPRPEYSIAWPTEILYAKRNTAEPAGYLMPRIDERQFREIGSYLNPTRRRVRTNQRGRGFTYLHMLNLAHNLACCVDTIHENDHVIGDLNSRNVRADDRGRVRIIDTDSFQVTDQDGNLHRCAVGTPEYTPPHLQKVHFADARRTQQDDLFGLAVMIYQILVQGHHPFSGIPVRKSDQEPATIADRIKHGPMVHTTPQKMIRPAPTSNMIWTALPLKRQFKAAFSKEPTAKRPTAQQWAKDIEAVSQRLHSCPRNPLHFYLGRSSCTWCRYHAKTKIEPFPKPQKLR